MYLDSYSLHGHVFAPSPPSATSSPTRSSHHSVLTSSSDASDASSSSSSNDVHIPPSQSKTYAFFSSPFSDNSPAPVPPPNPPSRSASLRSQVSISPPTPDETPKVDSHSPPRSLNADFFSSSYSQPHHPSIVHPTPPPSIRSLTTSSSVASSSVESPSPPSSPPNRLLPLLSRLFPSRARYTNIDGLPTREPSLILRRDFVNVVEDQEKFSHHHQHNSSNASHHHHPHHPHHHLRSSSATPDPNSERDPEHVGSESLLPPTSATTTTSLSSPLPPVPSLALPLAINTFNPTPPTPASVAATAADGVGVELKPGDVISDPDKLSLELVRTLGQGAFSSVWLARDVNHQLAAFELTRRSSLKKSRSLSRLQRMKGTRPHQQQQQHQNQYQHHGDDRSLTKKASANLSEQRMLSRQCSLPTEIYKKDPEDSVLARATTTRLVAVKMTDRRACEVNERSRVSFVREVEVLRHISHPSIVSYLHAFSTPSHHCLVLEHVGGGDLFDLVDSEESHSKLDEPLVRRMFGELCKAVGWMHGVGLVHRDIKLENILLTSHPFNSSSSPLPLPPHPLIKLTDFGLSRFVDPSDPLLTTRCGSESYASPELVTGRPYDGRETDAWSCGVVLYALATRRLPFDRVVMGEEEEEGGGGRRAVVVREEVVGQRDDYRNGSEGERRRRERESYGGGEDGYSSGGGSTRAGMVASARGKERSERKALLIRIAKGEYEWPELPPPPLPRSSSSWSRQGQSQEQEQGGRERRGGVGEEDAMMMAVGAQQTTTTTYGREEAPTWKSGDLFESRPAAKHDAASEGVPVIEGVSYPGGGGSDDDVPTATVNSGGVKGVTRGEEEEVRKGKRLGGSEGIRRVVGKLLVRDPRKRTKVVDLWEDEWMRGEGSPLPPSSSTLPHPHPHPHPTYPMRANTAATITASPISPSHFGPASGFMASPTTTTTTYAHLQGHAGHLYGISPISRDSSIGSGTGLEYWTTNSPNNYSPRSMEFFTNSSSGGGGGGGGGGIGGGGGGGSHGEDGAMVSLGSSGLGLALHQIHQRQYGRHPYHHHQHGDGHRPEYGYGYGYGYDFGDEGEVNGREGEGEGGVEGNGGDGRAGDGGGEQCEEDDGDGVLVDGEDLGPEHVARQEH